jgi:acyl-coenzyme A synthetase/AMP-(fatty) acid ligase
VGRAAEVIHGVCGRVYPAQVQHMLLTHPAIRDAVVFSATPQDR